MTDFKALLKRWYRNHKRDLPWRMTKDPYKIWVSEIILQQTRVNQGLGYYDKFIKQYPDICSLARTDEDSLLKVWQGLGYYSRARNMHVASRQIMEEHHGKFPDNVKAIRNLKGIGEYTAHAIASIAFNRPCVVVDGNVLRVMARMHGITGAVQTAEVKRKIKEILSEKIDRQDPGEFNEALMEFGALHCKPFNPACGSCPFNQSCYAYKNDLVSVLPVRKPRIKKVIRYFNYAVPLFKKDEIIHTLLYKRQDNDIWKGLFEFPLLESKYPVDRDQLFLFESISQLVNGNPCRVIGQSRPYRHQLTHQIIHSRFFIILLDEEPSRINEWQSTRVDTIHNYAFPRLIDRFLKSDWPEVVKKIK